MSSRGGLIENIHELPSFTEFGQQKEFRLTMIRLLFADGSGRNELNDVLMTRQPLEELDFLVEKER